MDLTLNDFRNILGKENDGDAVFTKDNNGNATGLEKANYGKLRKHNVKGVSADDSVTIREQFVAAIRRAIPPEEGGTMSMLTGTLPAIKELAAEL